MCVQGGHGKVNFFSNTGHYLRKYKGIKEVIALGTCGSLNEKLQVGHIVIGRASVEHDKKIHAPEGELPKFFPHKDWLERIKGHLVEMPFCSLGVIASGDEDILSRERALELRNQTGADVVAWEGAGGAKACQKAKVNYIEIRGVTDRPCQSYQVSPNQLRKIFKENLPQVMKKLAQVLINLPPSKDEGEPSPSSRR